MAAGVALLAMLAIGTSLASARTKAVLVKDIYPGVESSSPRVLAEVNGMLFFVAHDRAHGGELWKSDGTAAGTTLVKDINPGSDGSLPFIVNFPDRPLRGLSTLFFRADDGVHGEELWKSDGTAAGTTLVKDINPGGDGSNPQHLTNLNGTLFFTASEPTTGTELWKSDGTVAGTTLVKDFNPGGGVRNLGNFNGTLFFTANDRVSGQELWKSNGTAAGTMLVKDIDPGPESSPPGWLTNVNGTLFFYATDGRDAHGAELWKSDGTAAGTTLVKDLAVGGQDAILFYLTSVNDALFFQVWNASYSYTGAELWKTDGTDSGTTLVRDINPGLDGSYPEVLTNVNGTLFFVAYDGAVGGLWRSDGTDTGTTLVKDIYAADDLINVNGTLFFRGNDGWDAHGMELWMSDGTAAGTTLVKDIYPGGNGYVNPLANVNGTLFFSAVDPAVGHELWKTKPRIRGDRRRGKSAP